MGGYVKTMHVGPSPGRSGPDGAVSGTLAAMGAFGIWAFFPVYFNQFGPGVSPWEILLHRVIWAEVALLGFILAKRLRLATLGLLQYIAPTGHFLVGVFLYGEPFTVADAITFGCIWTGLIIYTTDMGLGHRTQTKEVS